MSRTPAAVPSSIGMVIRPSEAIKPTSRTGVFAEKFGVAAQVGPHRPAHPVRQELEVGPVILGKKAAGLVRRSVRAPGRGLVAAPGLAAQLVAGSRRGYPSAASIVPSARSRIKVCFLAIAQPGHRQDRAGIGRDDRAQIAVDREPKRDVVLRFDVLDPRGDRRHAVLGSDQTILHVGRQAR